MFRRNRETMEFLVKAMDIIKLILGILAIVMAVVVLINPDENVKFVPNVLICAGILNLLHCLKQYLRDEYRSFIIHLVVGGVITIVGVLLRIMM